MREAFLIIFVLFLSGCAKYSIVPVENGNMYSFKDGKVRFILPSHWINATSFEKQCLKIESDIILLVDKVSKSNGLRPVMSIVFIEGEPAWVCKSFLCHEDELENTLRNTLKNKSIFVKEYKKTHNSQKIYFELEYDHPVTGVKALTKYLYISSDNVIVGISVEDRKNNAMVESNDLMKIKILNPVLP